MKNTIIAKILYQVADAFELRKVEWKPRAYRRAAQSLEGLSEDVEEIYKRGGKKALQEIPFIGEGIASHIEEYLLTGKVKEWFGMFKEMPQGLEELMRIGGLGPKKVDFLYKKLHIKNIEDLKNAILSHKLQMVSGFGEKTEKNLLESLGLYKAGQERMLLGRAIFIGEELVNRLKRFPSLKRIEYAGSLRRKEETIGDIDILITSKEPDKIMQFFTSMKDVKKVLAKGETRSAIILDSGVQCDLRVLDDNLFGAALLYFTGSKEHNIALRNIAIKKGYKLSEYGLFDTKNNKNNKNDLTESKKNNFKENKLIAGKTESDVYAKLGMKYIEPEMRENTGEILAAQKNELPNLVSLQDIKGDFHTHTNYSDGSHSIEQMVKEAMNLGYEYISISDHSKSEPIAHGMNEERLKEQWKEIDRVQKRVGEKIRILKSSEVDILADGTTDFPNDILKRLDITIASVHSGFKMPKEKMTKRIIRALENPYVDILGHPSGRIINRRNAYNVDIEKIFLAAKQNHKVIEINAAQERLDLRDIHIKTAVQKDVWLSINTDAHTTSQLHQMHLGVAQARRGWAEKKNIVNTLSLKKLKSVFERIR